MVHLLTTVTFTGLAVLLCGCGTGNWIHPEAAEAIAQQQAAYKPVVIPPVSGHEIRIGASSPGDSFIIAGDGTFLGRLTTEYEKDSIANEFGDYGSEFSRTSMFNQFSEYGSEFGRFSAMNSYSSDPPRLFIGEGFAAWVTVNEFKNPRVDPRALRAKLRSNR
jgi:hypothetical protein